MKEGLITSSVKTIWLFCLMAIGLLLGADVYAADIGTFAQTIATNNLTGIRSALTSASYVAGFAMILGAIMKFKQHKDNPQSVPVSTPMTLLLVGGALLGLPTIVDTAGATVFGGTSSIKSSYN